MILFLGLRMALVRSLFGLEPFAVVDSMRKISLLANVLVGSGQFRVQTTSRPRGDGGGAQLQASLAVMVMSLNRGMRYVHTPLRSVAHSEGPEERWVQRWNEILKFPDLLRDEHRVIDLDSRLSVCRGLCSRTASIVLFSSSFRSIADSSGRFYERYRNQVRALYHPEFPRSASSQSGLSRSIAVHVRRGDVAEVGPQSFRFTANHKVLSVLDKLRSNDTFDQVTVFSNGSRDDLGDFAYAGHVIDSRSDALRALEDIVASDIFVMSKSSYSYLGGLLSSGRVVYEPFWHPPLPSWETWADLGGGRVGGALEGGSQDDRKSLDRSRFPAE